LHPLFFLNDKIGILSHELRPKRTWPLSCTCPPARFEGPLAIFSFFRAREPPMGEAYRNADLVPRILRLLPMPALSKNRYDCSERLALLNIGLLVHRHLYGTGSDRMIMADLPDHRSGSGLVP